VDFDTPFSTGEHKAMNMKRIWIWGMAALTAVVVLTGCDNEGGSLNKPSSDVSGAWLYSDTGNNQSTWALVQSEDGTLDGAATDGAIITGTLQEDELDLTLTYSDASTSILDGTVETNVMTGTFRSSTQGSGTWSAVKTN
jgi:hypothetical protein